MVFELFLSLGGLTVGITFHFASSVLLCCLKKAPDRLTRSFLFKCCDIVTIGGRLY